MIYTLEKYIQTSVVDGFRGVQDWRQGDQLGGKKQ